MKIIKTTLLALALQSAALNAVAYETYDDCDVSHRWWINVGLGAGANLGGTPKASGAAGQLSFNGMISEKLFITIENTAIVQDQTYDERTSREIGLLLGYKSKHPNWYWSGAAGIAYYRNEIEHTHFNWNRYSYNTYYTHEESKGAAMPVEAQLFWTPVKHFGIGLIGHGLVAKNASAVALLGIQIS